MTRPSLLFRLINSIRLAIRYHGIWFPFVAVQRVWLSFYRRTLGRKTFNFRGKQHPYWVHPLTLDNERTVEVSIARAFLDNPAASILEVGNVLSNYFSIPHDVVDKYELTPGVINEDIISYSPEKKYDLIVTVSTLEHVGWDETPREPEKISRAISRLQELLKDNGQLLVTMPLGYNSYVDQLVQEDKLGLSDAHYLLRISADNQWREASKAEIAHAAYGSPFPCANAVVVACFRKSH